MNLTERHKPELFELITTWIGSPMSFAIHTVAFIASFSISIFGFVPWQTVLLVVTTIVSLEAIYLSIFIQMTVNRHAHELAEVSEDVEEIHEDLEEISEDVEEIQEDIEDINEDEADEQRKQQQTVTLETMTKDIQRLLSDLEELKKGK